MLPPTRGLGMAVEPEPGNCCAGRLIPFKRETKICWEQVDSVRRWTMKRWVLVLGLVVVGAVVWLSLIHI